MQISSHEKKYIEQLHRDNGHVEIRTQKSPGKWETKWSQYPHRTEEYASQLNRFQVYTSLNKMEIPPDLPPEYLPPSKNSTVSRITRLLFDFDPVREKNVSSTKEELLLALQMAKKCRAALSSQGWPLPAIAISGNGAHLQYRCAMPNGPKVNRMLSMLYFGLFQDFSDDHVRFDRAVRNPGRICTLYGTKKRKGQHDQHRPHRTSRIKLPPHRWEQVPTQTIVKTAQKYMFHVEHNAPDRRSAVCQIYAMRDDQDGIGDLTTLDIVSWFSSHNKYIRHLDGCKHYVRCPWEDEHTVESPARGGDTLIFEASGRRWPNFYCAHDHCADRTLLAVLDLWPDYGGFCSKTWNPKKVLGY